MLAVSALMFMLVPDLIYSIHNTMFEITRESYNLAIYSFLGLFKITILVFNIVPYIALRIIGR